MFASSGLSGYGDFDAMQVRIKSTMSTEHRRLNFRIPSRLKTGPKGLDDLRPTLENVPTGDHDTLRR